MILHVATYINYTNESPVVAYLVMLKQCFVFNRSAYKWMIYGNVGGLSMKILRNLL